MQRVFAIVVVLGVLAIGGTVWAAAIPAVDSTESQISDAFARVLDRTLPMSTRVANLESGKQLRATLREFDALKKVAGYSLSDVRLHVREVRALRGDAEVQLEIVVNSAPVTGWSGVAHKIDGQWLVASDTVCAIFAEWTRVRCPGGPGTPDYTSGRPAKSKKQGSERVVPLTFADGDRADLLIPSDLPTGWRILPHAALVLEDETTVPVYFQPGRSSARQAVRSYPGAAGRPDVELDAMNGLMIQLGKWTAFVHVDRERERERIAKHLDGYTTASGFPVLIPSGPLAFDRPEGEQPPDGVVLAKSALNIDDAANPVELSYSDGDTIFVSVVITPGPCPAVLQRAFVSGNYAAEERCTANGFGRIAVEGNTDFVTRLLDELHVENYRAAPVLSTA